MSGSGWRGLAARKVRGWAGENWVPGVQKGSLEGFVTARTLSEGIVMEPRERSLVVLLWGDCGDETHQAAYKAVQLCSSVCALGVCGGVFCIDMGFHYVAHTGLEQTQDSSPASVSQVLGLQDVPSWSASMIFSVFEELYNLYYSCGA